MRSLLLNRQSPRSRHGHFAVILKRMSKRQSPRWRHGRFAANSLADSEFLTDQERPWIAEPISVKGEKWDSKRCLFKCTDGCWADEVRDKDTASLVRTVQWSFSELRKNFTCWSRCSIVWCVVVYGRNIWAHGTVRTGLVNNRSCQAENFSVNL